MIHLDFADGTSATLTQEQFKQQYPELYEIINRPAPYKEYADKLKDIRRGKRITLREMAKGLGMKASALSDIELGHTQATQTIVDYYHTVPAYKPEGHAE